MKIAYFFDEENNKDFEWLGEKGKPFNFYGPDNQQMIDMVNEFVDIAIHYWGELRSFTIYKHSVPKFSLYQMFEIKTIDEDEGRGEDIYHYEVIVNRICIPNSSQLSTEECMNQIINSYKTISSKLPKYRLAVDKY